MQQNKVTSDDSWNISASEDEEEAFTSARNSTKVDQELKRKKKKLYNLEGQQPISKHIALLYKDIEKNGWIELTCKCPRRGQTKKESQPQTSQSSTNSVVTKLDSYHLPIGQSPSKSKSRPEYQAFDYKEDEERPYVAKSSSAKKTPVSGKRPKKIASMTNVVNELKRHKLLDDMENATLEKEQKKLKTEEKDSRVTVDFDSQDSIPDIKEGVASQINRVETMLDAKENKKVKGKEK
ncbi:uncharacterized protein LOC135683039 [Rhopilema esculentum]|uniref:uncharacterized protein LOC135683039 n=1 Tax=Rhopilema esculentum TaxID=499914 RepID=UPI0031D05A7F